MTLRQIQFGTIIFGRAPKLSMLLVDDIEEQNMEKMLRYF
jgi:hypothetical protein